MKNFSVGILIYFVIASLVMWFVPVIRDDRDAINYIYMSFTGLSAVAGLVAVKIIGMKGDRGRSLLTSVSATISWFLGELIWTIDYLRLGEVPFPSLGDLFFLIGYILFLICLILEIRMANITLRAINKQIISISLLVAFLSIGAFALFTSSLTYSGDSSLWENIVTIGYGVGDVILIITGVFLIQLIWIYRGGKISMVWHFLLLGFIFITVADFLYGIYFDQYEVGINPITNIINIIYIAGYCSIAVHYLKFSEVIQHIQRKALQKTHK